MENAASGDSTIQDSTVNTDAFNCTVTANNSPINTMTVNYFYGDRQTGRSTTGDRFIDEQETHPTQDLSSSHDRRRTVTFAEETTSRLRNPIADQSEMSQIPPNISRLLNTREEFAQVPEPARSIGHSCSVAETNTTTGGRPVSLFKAIEESRQTIKGHLKLRIGVSVIRKYMQSEFFFSNTAIPLWEPSPGLNSPEGIKTSNVCVGDVGFFTPEGGFYVLFNAFLSYTGNTDIGFDPPKDFESYGPVRFSGDVSNITQVSYTDYVPFYGDFKPDSEIPRHSERTYISSYHVVKKKSKTLRSGTLLDLPNGVWRDRLHLRVVLAMQGYFGLHAESWYNYYLKQSPGPTIPEGHLYIVSGTYKCSAWALAFCSTPSPEDIFARLYKLYPNSDVFYQWDRQGPVVGRRGPHSSQLGEDGLPIVNQCVAVEVYAIEKTKRIEKAGASISRFMSRLSIMSRSSTVKSRTSF